MSLRKVLNSLEKSWERENILLKIKNGSGTEEIVNEFLANNKIKIKKLSALLRSEDIDLLNQAEQLSYCIAKLINKIKYLNSFENNLNKQKKYHEKISFSNLVPTNKISIFMINWGNKVVIIALLIISAIALSKQALV